MKSSVSIFFAPAYLLGAILAGMLCLISIISSFKVYPANLHIFFCVFDILMTAAFLFALSRAFAFLKIAGSGLTFRNGLGIINGYISSANSLTKCLKLYRANDSELEGPVVDETSNLAKGTGRFLRLFFDLFSKPFLLGAAIFAADPDDRQGLESFLVLTWITASSNLKAKVLLPDTYSWNSKIYQKLEDWLNGNGIPIEKSQDIDFVDQEMFSKGNFFLVGLVLIPLCLLGALGYVFLK